MVVYGPGLTGMDLHRRLAADDPGLGNRMVFVTGGAFTAESSSFSAGTASTRPTSPSTSTSSTS